MIFDFHCHFSRSFFRYREYRMALDGLLDGMEKHGVERAVISAAGEYAAYFNTEGNDEIAAAARCHPERLTGFATVNPWKRAAAVEEVRRSRQDLGLAGLVLHPMLHGHDANDPLVFPVVEEAIRLRMPVYITGGAPLLAVPYKIADVAGRYPEARFVMGHAGWDFHFDVMYCLEACPNLWVETSRNEIANLDSIVRKCGAGRVLFGSDHPFSSYESEIAKIRLLPDVTPDDIDRILGRNAVEFLEVPA